MVRKPLHKTSETPSRLASVTWVIGDAANAGDARAAAEGVQAIVHAVNPPGYRDWEKLVLPMIDNGVAAAKAVGAFLRTSSTTQMLCID
jgi:uncharacterized protein YbjT (DUF2867 family)